ncbi:hypothetical protein LRAMOSA03122 [Lichtheimia ramosa]|uniref:HNH domain-containing protein n=1 Tax=Lichtheimia ramosa TaxID=688394 RepID=A0A077WS39_9FUNG|nr:hypothetical protein LRAMOSA03122 [Lichtheimia ramosa]
MPRQKQSVVMPSRKSLTIYENWKVYSLQGKLMFRCNQKKARWYLDRELAVKRDKEEHAIQLTFEAKGQGHDENDYMIEDRKNICVVCASQAGLTLHHVVPYVYRQWFPLAIKSKSSRDLLLLCKECHDRYERHATAFKKSLALEHDMPMEGKGWIVIPEHRTMRKTASALISAANKMPIDRRQQLEQIIYEYWMQNAGWENLSWGQVLEKCTDFKDMERGPDFIEHGQGVVQHLMSNMYMNQENKERWPDLEKFIKQWRQHFLDYAQPSHLSSKWSVDSDIYTNGA